jgi:uncharacterized protein (TIGR01244 family)
MLMRMRMRIRVQMLLLWCVALTPGCMSLKQPPQAARPIGMVDGIAPLSFDGTFYFGGQPTRDGLSHLAERGVRTVINLRTADEMADADFAEAAAVVDLGMDYIHLPITGATLNRDSVTKLKEHLGTMRPPALIHCRSSNRVGALWALYLYHELDIELDAAIEYGRQAGLTSPALVENVRDSVINSR